MAKLKTIFFCTECGNETPRWAGQCPACREWNTLVEEPTGPRRAGRGASTRASAPRRGDAPAPSRLADVVGGETTRWTTGIDEFDFVLGGGVVPGSLVLVGGEPG